MAKINVKIPEPKEAYDVSNQKQINRAIAIIIEQLSIYFGSNIEFRTNQG